MSSERCALTGRVFSAPVFLHSGLSTTEHPDLSAAVINLQSNSATAAEQSEFQTEALPVAGQTSLNATCQAKNSSKLRS